MKATLRFLAKHLGKMKASTVYTNPFLFSCLSFITAQYLACTLNMSTDDDDVDEDTLWRRSYEKSLIKQKYNNSEEHRQLKKDLLQLKKTIFEAQLRKELLLEEEARFRTKAAEVYWSKLSLEYQIARLNHQKAEAEAINKQKEDTASLEDLMDISVKKPSNTVNLTPYTDSE